MTDVDAMARKVGNLEKFRTRVESAISFVEGLQAAGFKPQAAAGEVVDLTDDQKAQVSSQFAEIIRPISDAIDLKLNSFDDRLKQLERSKAEGGELSDRLMAMLTWFETNQEGLELLLSLDGDVDLPKGPEGAPGATETVSGAVPGATGTGGASGASGTAGGASGNGGAGPAGGAAGGAGGAAG